MAVASGPKVIYLDTHPSARIITTAGGCLYNQDRGMVFEVEAGAATAADDGVAHGGAGAVTPPTEKIRIAFLQYSP